MKRAYDHSFVNDTDFANTIASHSLLPHIAAQATHPHLGYHPAIQHNYPLAAYPHSANLTPTLELRVPLLPTRASVNPDFQSNAYISRHPPQVDGLQRHQAHFLGVIQPPLAGLGILYDSTNEPVAPAFVSQQFDTNTPRALGTREIYTPQQDICIQDICYADSSPAAGAGDDLSRQIHHDKDPPFIADNTAAYSECPISDFTAHAPSASSSVPSLSYGNSTDDSSLSVMDISLAQDPLRALLDIYSPPLRSDGTSEPLVGIFADINMREATAMCELPTFGVNPADVMGDEPNVKAKSPEPGELGRLLLSLSPDFDICDDTQHTSATEAQFPDDAINVIVSVLSASKREEDVQQLEAVLEQHSTPPPRRPDPFLFSQNLSTQPPMPPSAPPMAIEQPISFVIPNLLMVPKLDQAPLVDVFAPPAEQPPFPVLDPPPVIVRHQSPVLNAHLGIELEDLRRRAEDFRRRNPGLDIDKTWLQAYAGRLSQRGELLDDYRCYVNGCSQRNKRRDHILVHVGSHVEHRPFQCNVCGMRFLRKNECKRHESSHGGHKPFSCPICAPYQERSFVRQDLLKRHMRVTHGVQGDASNDRKKRMRFSRDEDVYWP